MHQQLIDTYKALMASLTHLPLEIQAAQSDLNDARRTAADTKRLLDEAEMLAVANAEGSNAEKRKADATIKLAGNGSFQRLSAALRKEQAEVAALQTEVDGLTNQFAAVGYQARLHAALFTFLGSAGAPIPANLDGLGDVVFQPVNYAQRGNGNSYVTAEDAAQIGL